MKIKILFGQRKERYDGEHAPEVLAAWDEYSVDENPSGWTEAVEKAKAATQDDMQAMRIIDLDISGDRIRELLIGTPTIKVGNILGTDEIVGKTIANITHETVDGSYGDEPIVYLHFTDGSHTGFVLPSDEE